MCLEHGTGRWWGAIVWLSEQVVAGWIWRRTGRLDSQSEIGHKKKGSLEMQFIRCCKIYNFHRTRFLVNITYCLCICIYA